jgi:glycosyltransferase involved in cell wall biosynthesis
MPKVSVVIPAYESEGFLAAAIESVLQQSFGDLELVVVDDGSSTRAAAEVVAGFRANSDLSIRYIYQDNTGVSGARNRGLAETTGKFVAFLDADDVFEPGKLTTQVKLLDSRPADYACVCGGRRVVPLGERPSRYELPSPADGDVYAGLVADRLSIRGTGAFLYRRSALDAVGAFDESLRNNEDFDLILRLARRFSICTHQDVVYQIRARRGSLSFGDPEKSLPHMLAFIDKLEREDPALPPALIQRKRQRAYFNAARKHLLRRGDFRSFSRTLREGVGRAGAPRSWRARSAYLFAHTGPLGTLITRVLFGTPKPPV